MSRTPRRGHDVLLVGGGLANSLIALKLCDERPDLRLVLVEQARTLGGRHTWSYHVGDLGPGDHEWLEPVVAASWPRYDVRFPGFSRRMSTGYRSITSERLHGTVAATLGDRVLLEQRVVAVRPDSVAMEDGTTLTATCVIDGRGYVGDWLVAGFQKFLGQHVTLSTAHGLDAPLLMDATVEQCDGFRFIYVLPWTTHRVLIEDTYYADDPQLPVDTLRARIGEYARSRGWRIARVDGEERGVLPIPLAGDLARLWLQHTPGVPTSGMRAGLFHHTTGYSLPNAVDLAERLAREGALESTKVEALVRKCATRSWRSQRFFRLLNRMLFRAAEPGERYRVLERFYRLPEATIARFYAGRVSALDRIRLLSGRPPVSVRRALRCVQERVPESWSVDA